MLQSNIEGILPKFTQFHTILKKLKVMTALSDLFIGELFEEALSFKQTVELLLLYVFDLLPDFILSLHLNKLGFQLFKGDLAKNIEALLN